jgi:hypothetical protein
VSTPELRRPRAAGELIGDGLRLWSLEARRLLAIGAIVAIPANVIVSGIGLEELWSDFEGEGSSAAATLIPTVLDYLVVLPLIVAMTVNLITTPAGSRSVARAVSFGLDRYRVVFWAVLLALLGSIVGLLLLIIPGIYLLVRWYFTTWMVVLDERRGPDALAGSGELVEGSWWRTFGIVLLANLAALVPVILIYVPFGIAGSALDSGALDLAGRTLGAMVAYPYVALVSTLLYFDLRARKEGVAAA